MATNIGTGPQDIPLNQFLGEMAFQDKATTVVAGSRVTNPNTTSAEWLYLPPNIQVIHAGIQAGYTSNNTNANERGVIQVQDNGTWKVSDYTNYGFNFYTAPGIGQGFGGNYAAIIPFYWSNNTSRETTMFTLNRLGTSNTFQFTLSGNATGGGINDYIVISNGYFSLNGELTGFRFTTVNGNANLNGSYWMNYSTR